MIFCWQIITQIIEDYRVFLGWWLTNRDDCFRINFWPLQKLALLFEEVGAVLKIDLSLKPNHTTITKCNQVKLVKIRDTLCILNYLNSLLLDLFSRLWSSFDSSRLFPRSLSPFDAKVRFLSVVREFHPKTSPVSPSPNEECGSRRSRQEWCQPRDFGEIHVHYVPGNGDPTLVLVNRNKHWFVRLTRTKFCPVNELPVNKCPITGT